MPDLAPTIRQPGLTCLHPPWPQTICRDACGLAGAHFAPPARAWPSFVALGDWLLDLDLLAGPLIVRLVAFSAGDLDALVAIGPKAGFADQQADAD